MEYPANSHSAKKREEPEPKHIDKVVTGQVVRKKKTLGKRFTDVFVGGDANSVWNYIAFDVLVPAAKDMMSDAVSQGIDRILFGEVTRSSGRRRRGETSRGYTSYNRYAPTSVRREREETRPMSYRARASHDFDEIILETRAEAERVIETMFDIISRYEQVTVSDLYDLVGVTGNFTDEKYGWTDIRGAGITRVRNGYLLDLPRPEQL